MNVVSEFRVFGNKRGFAWKFNGKDMEKRFQHDILSVVELKDKSGFGVVAHWDDYGSHNAMIINGDGTLRALLEIPFNTDNYPRFLGIYYSLGRLETMISGDHGLLGYACTVDEKTGELIDCHVTK